MASIDKIGVIDNKATQPKVPLPLWVHHEVLPTSGLNVPIRATRRPYKLLSSVLNPAILLIFGGLRNLDS